MPKFKKNKNKPSKVRNPLHIDIESSTQPYCKLKKSNLSECSNENFCDEDFSKDESRSVHIPKDLSKKILKEANQQLLNDFFDEEFTVSVFEDDSSEFTVEKKSNLPIDNDGLIYIDENELEVVDGTGLDDSYWSELLKKGANEYENDIYEKPKSDIVDSIITKLRENQLNESSKDNFLSNSSLEIPEKVEQVYRSIGEWLSKYKSGKIPKAFTIIPRLENWEEIIYITEPHNWSPNAMNEAVKIFCSNLSPKDSLKFYSKILYPAIRTNISQNYGKLNYHYYQALKKAMFKPAAWFKGILLPLAEDETCTVKEAVIIGSILSKVSIPVLHTAAAIIKLSQIKPWNTCQTHFIMVLLSKKYSMPRKVLEELVNNFVKFDQSLNPPSDNENPLFSHNNVNLNSNNALTNSILPVTWHKTLLTFVQRYKYELSSIQIKKLQDLVKNQHHYLISPEINRELSHSLIKLPNEELDVKMNN